MAVRRLLTVIGFSYLELSVILCHSERSEALRQAQGFVLSLSKDEGSRLSRFFGLRPQNDGSFVILNERRRVKDLDFGFFVLRPFDYTQGRTLSEVECVRTQNDLVVNEHLNGFALLRANINKFHWGAR